MRFPFVVIPGLTERQRTRYRKHMDSDRSGWHRRWTESIWRRHQDPSNARSSGWCGAHDRRRRLIHFYDEYGVEGDDFVLRSAYLWVNVTLPEDDTEEYRAAVLRGLSRGGWERELRTADGETHRRGDLEARFTLARRHAEDESRGYVTPAGYRSLTLRLRTRGSDLPAGIERRPWRWFHEVGMRPILEPGAPTPVEPEDLASFFPAQLELGCGPSTEAGVPHLSNLHRIYGVSKGDFSFIFKAADDRLLEVLANPEGKYREMTEIYRACVVAEPTDFYRSVRKLADRGLIVGPVITNNFDCLCADVGLEEISLRRYDTEPYYPMSARALADDIDFDPRARTLLVVGVHADRRQAQMRARERGLKIVYVDPERYFDPAGRLISYPVEAPQTGDAIVRLPAGAAFERLMDSLAAALPAPRRAAGTRSSPTAPRPPAATPPP